MDRGLTDLERICNALLLALLLSRWIGNAKFCRIMPRLIWAVASEFLAAWIGCLIRWKRRLLLRMIVCLTVHFSTLQKSCSNATDTTNELCQYLDKMFNSESSERISVTTFLATLTAGVGRVGGELGSTMI